ncbi:MAG: hypothetical protein MUD12_04595 [Spirochaetes bacterium]|jgi:hypothetical protein|nr:hypothetical protein [Spirochaetota bacterium]
MEAFFIFIIFIIIFFLWLSFNRQKKTVRLLEKRIGELEKSVSPLPGIEHGRDETPQAAEAKDISGRKITEKQVPAKETTPPVELPKPAPAKAATVPEKTAAPSLLKRFEKQFSANWTGIIGAVIMVMGIAFLGVYAALALSAVYRFIMICSVAAVLLSLYFFLRSKPSWGDLAQWLRSGSGALFLFACLGSGGIPGLKWIDDRNAALGLLMAGIITNLYFGYAGRTQVFASLHAVISLAALGIAPQSGMTLMLAAAIALLSISITFRSPWDYHLLITIAAFFTYHLFWYNSPGAGGSDLQTAERVTGIACVASVGIAALFVHYRSIYSDKVFAPLPFIVHLLNWGFTAAGLLVYSTGSKWNTPILAAAAVAAFLLSRRAKKLKADWLHSTDTLIAISILLFSLLTLGRWGAGPVTIALAVYIEMVAFHIAAVKHDSGFLRRISAPLRHMAAAGFIITGFASIDKKSEEITLMNSVHSLIVLAAETLFHVYQCRTGSAGYDSIDSYFTGDPRGKTAASGVFLAVMGLLAYIILIRYPWAGAAVSAFAVMLLVLREKYRSPELKTGLFLLLPSVQLIGWIHISSRPDQGTAMDMVYLVPFLVSAAAAAVLSHDGPENRRATWPGIYLFTSHLMFTVYMAAGPFSPHIAGTAWLIFSIIYLEAAGFYGKRTSDPGGTTDLHLLHAGYFLIAAFITRHLLVDLQLEDYIGLFHQRMLIQTFAIAAFIYWATAGNERMTGKYRSWISLQPLMWELALVFAVLIVLLEVPQQWHPASWVIFASALLFAGNMTERLGRFRLYSVFFHWAASFSVAFLSSTGSVPSDRWIDQNWVGGCAAVVLQFFHVIYFFKKSDLSSAVFPGPLAFLDGIRTLIDRKKNPWIYYPYFASIALFLYWSFDRSVLTLLWVAESFALFILSLAVKENHFRVISQIGLGLCLVRLIFFDLAQSGTLMRAVVFVGVGGMMLVMNALYNKYRDRF